MPQKIAILIEIQTTGYLFEQHLSYPLPEAYVDNLVQICPRHATHDTIPAKKTVLSLND